MPILEINILGSKTEINYQKAEEEKLNNLIKQFNARLSEFENLKGKFADSKIILLTALKAEDRICELQKKIDEQRKIIDSTNNKENNDSNIKEIIKLKDKVSLLEGKNLKLENLYKMTVNEFDKLNNKIISMVERIVNSSNENN